jgi:ribokinase
MVIMSERIPAPGETILGGTFFMNPGGKGANQAVAAARAGGDVVFVCKVGADIFGSQSVENFEEAGIDTTYVATDPVNPSGVALITVDKQGENSIVVASGANNALRPEHIGLANDEIMNASVVLTQLETPMDTVLQLAELVTAGTTFILNPAPAAPLSDDLLKKVTIITPNEHEAGMLTGLNVKTVDDAAKAAAILNKKGVNTVIVTMGSEGALLYHEGKKQHIPAVKVKSVDSTAAGDVFNGALAVALAEKQPMADAVRFACAAAAISVTRKGAQASAPYRKEIKV